MAPRGLLIDIDGVLTVSWEALPGIVEALASLRRARMPMRFLTNTTSRTRTEIASLLHGAGLDISEDEVITAPLATASYLREHHPGARCLLLSSGDMTADLGTVDLVDHTASPADVDVVILGGAGPEFTYDALNRVFECLLGGADLVAIHRNLSWRTARGTQLDTGAFLAGLEATTGVRAVLIGKPAPAMFEAGLASLGMEAGEVAMIGDDLDNDVGGAQALGITGVLVRTGKFHPSQLEDGPAPDLVIDSFADLARWDAP